MKSDSLTAGGLFSVAAALLVVAWAISEHGRTHQRFQAGPMGRILDTVTGEVKACGVRSAGERNPFDRFDCTVIVAAQR